jgi:hypothetical protein
MLALSQRMLQCLHISVVQEEKDTLAQLDDCMWNPALQIPVEFRNLEPIWRKLNKVLRIKLKQGRILN